jgi:hypothetical protein
MGFVYEDRIYDPNIATVQFFNSGTLYSYPVIDLDKADESLLLSWDDLSGGQKELQYTIIHCDAAWNPSNLFTSDYIDGSTYENVTHIEPSFNTLIKYTHYWLYMPGEYMKPRIAGNYLLKVYVADNEDSVVITRRFYVLRNKVFVSGEVKRPSYPNYRNTKQEVDFMVNYKGLEVMNPMNDIRVVVRQNNRWDNAIIGLRPKFISDQAMYFDYEEENLFDGGSEFRFFDLRSYLNAGFGVQKIRFDSIYHMILYADDDKSYLSYSHWTDVNGERIIASDRKEDRVNELDYVMAHFRLLTPYPFDEGGAYVYGALSDWKLDPRFRLIYNEQKKYYEASILLKQGYYNFQYVWQAPGANAPDALRFEGNHYETENNYLILVYFHSSFLNCDELLGICYLNSQKK